MIHNYYFIIIIIIIIIIIFIIIIIITIIITYIIASTIHCYYKENQFPQKIVKKCLPIYFFIKRFLLISVLASAWYGLVGKSTCAINIQNFKSLW